MEEDSSFELKEARVVEVNEYPFLYAHFTRDNALSDELIEEYNISPLQNRFDSHMLVTYRNGIWYEMNIFGLRTGEVIHQTILSSIFAQ